MVSELKSHLMPRACSQTCGFSWKVRPTRLGPRIDGDSFHDREVIARERRGLEPTLSTELCRALDEGGCRADIWRLGQVVIDIKVVLDEVSSILSMFGFVQLSSPIQGMHRTRWRGDSSEELRRPSVAGCFLLEVTSWPPEESE